MRVLLAHNRYAHRGGEDTVFDQERALLRSRGHEVHEYVRENRHIDPSQRATLGLSTVWSSEAHAAIKALIERTRPDVLHVHNTLPLISPAVYYAAADCGVPVVQTLHNYRLLCANGMLLRASQVCEDCVGHAVGWSAVRHGCYRGHRAATAAVVGAMALHRAVGTWRRKVARYIALCEFARNKLLQAGLPPERVVVRPNFARDDFAGRDLLHNERDGALFLGRLSVEKGVNVMAEAWRAGLDVPLTVMGAGDLEPALRQALGAGPHRMLGFVDDDLRADGLQRAAFVVMPSLVYEGFPMVVAEAYSAGTPIIASRLGALAELVDDGVTGLHVDPGDPVDLAAKVRWAHAHPEAMRAMGRRAREVYLQRYTADVSYRRLIEIYDEARELVPAVA